MPEAKPLRYLYSALDNYGGYPFADQFDVVKPVYQPEEMTSQNGCLVIWGGGDISPSIYGQYPCSRTGAGVALSPKDQLELNLAGRALKMGIPILGICRGAQMMCCLAGGKLVQDVSGHAGTSHLIETDTGKSMGTTSVHHQMMFPWDISNYVLIAWTSELRSKMYLEGNPMTEDEPKDVVVKFPANIESKFYEPEIIYLPNQKALCIQGHPEFINNEKHEFVIYSKQLMQQYLIGPFLK